MQLQLANAITLSRILAVPVMYLLAWYGISTAFLLLLGYCFFSDLVDGYVARRLGQSSEFGAKLDSISDYLVYTAMPVCGYWLWPELMLNEWPFAALAVLCYLLPCGVGLWRFGRLPTYHTLGAKLAALAVGGGAWLSFAGLGPWPFRLALPVLVLAALEQIAISLLVNKPQANIQGIWCVLPKHKSSI